MYRHHGHDGDRHYWTGKDQEYHMVPDKKGRTKSDQNRTVKGALKPGAKFTFTIHFENLARVELGALLWVLEMEGEQYHRLGFAKPLGFGSLRLSVSDVSVVNLAERYGIDEGTGTQSLSAASRRSLVEQFKTAMQRAYQEDFDDLPPIRELFTLLSAPDPDYPIHYPRTDSQPAPDGKNFEWFMGNTRNKDARYTLEMPGEEQGLPLIDRYGKVKK